MKEMCAGGLKNCFVWFFFHFIIYYCEPARSAERYWAAEWFYGGFSRSAGRLLKCGTARGGKKYLLV